MSTLDLWAEEANTQLTDIQYGMMVRDSTGHQVGTVKHIEFADGTNQLGLTEDELVLTAPKPTRIQMKRAGFIRIGTGLLRKDRYATSYQIDQVVFNEVYLNVATDELLTF